jgi:hypothetical protein
MPSLTAVVGAATAAYSTAVIASPRVLIRPSGLADTRDTRILTRALGARDAAIGLAMIAAPGGRARSRRLGPAVPAGRRAGRARRPLRPASPPHRSDSSA